MNESGSKSLNAPDNFWVSVRLRLKVVRIAQYYFQILLICPIYKVSTSLKYQTQLVENVKGQKEIGIDPQYFAPTIEMIKKISEYTSTIVRLQNEMTEARKTANNIENLEERATMYGINVKGFFDEIRYAVDKLELIVDDDEWPLPKYRELLLIK